MPLPGVPTHTKTPIKHVVILIQENRSFDNFFATYPGADGATTGLTSSGKVVPLTKAPLLDKDIGHMHFTFLTEYDGGKMDGFDKIAFDLGGKARLYPYQYVDPKEIEPYWSIAQQYVLGDRMFQTQSSGSFTAHQYLVAGTTAVTKTESIVDIPTSGVWGCDAPVGTVTSLLTDNYQYLQHVGPYPCFDYPTIANLLDAHKVSWKYYTPRLMDSGAHWNAFEAIRAVRKGPEWETNVISREVRIFQDIDADALPAVSWVIPSSPNSDHPGSAGYGPSWVASVVNAIGTSQYWKDTAIFIVWDDWGGFYDHVAPPQLDYNGLGFRVPFLVVSPYAKQGYISHTRYEFGSLLKFIEVNWHLGNLGTTDVRSNSVRDVFQFGHEPRRFVPIKANYSREFFERQPPSNEPVDNE